MKCLFQDLVNVLSVGTVPSDSWPPAGQSCCCSKILPWVTLDIGSIGSINSAPSCQEPLPLAFPSGNRKSRKNWGDGVMVAMWFLFVGNEKAIASEVRCLDRCEYRHCSRGLKMSQWIHSYVSRSICLEQRSPQNDQRQVGFRVCTPLPVFMVCMGMGRLWEVLQKRNPNCSVKIPFPAGFAMQLCTIRVPSESGDGDGRSMAWGC